MSGYIGSQPADSFLSISSQQITGNGGATYTLNLSVTSPEDVAVFVNNVRQNPNTYSVSNNQITLGGTIASSDSCYVIFLGKTLATVNPPSGSVGLTQLSATGTKNNTTFLRGDNTFATPSGGVNTPAFEAKLSGTQNIGDDSITKLQFATEIFDTAGNYDNSSNYRFTPTTAGKYFCYLTQSIQQTGGVSQLNHVFIYIYKNGSAYKRAYADFSNNNGYALDVSIATTIDFNGSSDYIEAYALSNTISGDGQALGDTYGAFGAYKLIGV